MAWPSPSFSSQSDMSCTHKQSPTASLSSQEHHRNMSTSNSDTSTSSINSPCSNLIEDPLAEFSHIFSMSPFQSSDLDLLNGPSIFPFQHTSNSSICSDHLAYAGSWVDSILYPSTQSSPRAYVGSPTEPQVKKTTAHTCRHEHRPQSKPGLFECKWKDCENPGPFTRKAVLMRHIDTQHISPRSFTCPDDQCGKTFNRKDNLDEHFRRIHWE